MCITGTQTHVYNRDTNSCVYQGRKPRFTVVTDIIYNTTINGILTEAELHSHCHIPNSKVEVEIRDEFVMLDTAKFQAAAK